MRNILWNVEEQKFWCYFITKTWILCEKFLSWHNQWQGITDFLGCLSRTFGGSRQEKKERSDSGIKSQKFWPHHVHRIYITCQKILIVVERNFHKRANTKKCRQIKGSKDPANQILAIPFKTNLTQQLGTLKHILMDVLGNSFWIKFRYSEKIWTLLIIKIKLIVRILDILTINLDKN